MRDAYRFSSGSLGSAPGAGARDSAEWSHSSPAARPAHAFRATSRRGPRCFRVGCRWRWWCGMVFGRLVAQGRESALPAGSGRYRSAARPERDCDARTTGWSKRHRQGRSATGRRGAASRSGSRHRDSHEDPSIRRKPRDSSSRATSQTLGEPFLRAGPPEDHRPRLRACRRVDTQRSAVHHHVAGRPRRCPHGHRRRSRRGDGARHDPSLRRGLWQPPRALTPGSNMSSRLPPRPEGIRNGTPRRLSPIWSEAQRVDPPASR
jgi:hypothetical protein